MTGTQAATVCTCWQLTAGWCTACQQARTLRAEQHECVQTIHEAILRWEQSNSGTGARLSDLDMRCLRAYVRRVEGGLR
jgi:hypothetical protein